MRDPVLNLRTSLLDARELLKDGVFYTLTRDERDSLFINADHLLEKLDTLGQSSLMVGLLGGTGVGKSTLMNALAGSDIASTSHRRPHTDTVLIYRYADTPYPSSLPVDRVPWKEFIHDAKVIRQIVLCDLPDFDSLVGAHRDHVVAFLEYLDVLIWVISPEKYADGRLYEFMRSVSKAKQNFYFVLNKVDILFDGHPVDEGFDQLQTVTESLERHLKDDGFENTPIYTLSAGEARGGDYVSPWNQFAAFRRHIFREREFKEIKTIKAANLDTEVMEFLGAFDRELLNMEVLQKAVEESRCELAEESSQWKQGFQESMSLWKDMTLIKTQLASVMTDINVLVGPSSVFAFFGQREMNSQGERERDVPLSFSAFTEEISTVLKGYRDRLSNYLVSQLMRKGVSSSLIGRVGDMAVPDGRSDETDAAIRHLSESYFASRRLPGSRIFIIIQYITYALLFFVLVGALAGEGAWEKLYENPSLGSGLNFIVTALYSLFSPRGLAALGSYALINIFFGYRFYARHRKMVKRRAEQLLSAFAKDVAVLWEEELEKLTHDLTAVGDDLRKHRSLIVSLKEK